LGKAYAKAQETQKQMSLYRPEYECLDNKGLVTAYSNACATYKSKKTAENEMRCRTLKAILKERGVLK
jgi:hypothetical protein